MSTKPQTRLRRAEVAHMLNGFVSGLSPYGVPSYPGQSRIPEHVARRLVSLGPALGMNYRIVQVGNSRMLLGRPVA